MDSQDEHTKNETDATADSGYEKHDVNVAKLLLATVASVVVVTAVIIAMFQLYVSETEEQVFRAVLAPESAALRELRAREDKALNSYGIIDTTQNVYRIPIERAMKLEADEAFRERTETEEGQ